MQDLRYAIRTLRKQPVFTLVAVLTLTLGIGANTAIFSLLYQALLRPLPYPDADRLVFVWNTYRSMSLPQASVSIPDYLDRKNDAPAVEDAALFTGRALNLAAEGTQPEQVRGLVVTPSFFSTLQRYPFIGRAFKEEEAQPNADKYVILTHRIWVSRFAGDQTIVGRDIRLNGEPHRVVGVIPADFELPGTDIAMLVPFSFTPQQMSDQGRGNEFSMMIARLRPGATVDEFNAQMTTIVNRVIDRLPARAGFMKSSGFGGFARPFREQLVGDARTPLLVLQAGVILLLLIACFNVANLLLMRATGRGREIAIRATLGAGRWRIIRQMLTEGVVLSLIGAAGGVLLGYAGLRVLIAMSARQIPVLAGATLHPAVLGFTLVLAVLTGLVFGIVPALAAARDTNTVLKDDSARSSAGRGTGLTRSALIVAETALALMLLVGAGLLIRSFAQLQNVNPGFSTDSVLTAQISLPIARYADPPARRAFWQRLLDSARAIPGVTAAGLTTNVPFNGNVSSGSYTIVGYTPPAGEAQPHARQEIVGGDYFKAMQIPLLEGRTFEATDTAEAAPVVVVDKYLVDRYFTGRSAIGQQIRRGNPNAPPFTIVGVVGTINSIDLAQPAVKERIYYPITQTGPGSMALVLKTPLEPTSLVAQVRAAVLAIDAQQPIYDVRTMDQWIARSLEGRRSPMMLLAIFGAVALILSAIGIYGVLSFAVAQRVREFGIRQALGADRRSILALVLTHGGRTAGIGILLGLAGAAALTRYLQTLLFGVRPHDIPVFAAVTVMLFAVAMLACYIPARRATKIDPMVALRDS